MIDNIRVSAKLFACGVRSPPVNVFGSNTPEGIQKLIDAGKPIVFM